MPRITDPWAQVSTIHGWQDIEVDKRARLTSMRPKFQTTDYFKLSYGRLPYRDNIISPAQVYTGASRKAYLSHLQNCLEKLPCETTLQIRWRHSKEVPAFSMDFLYLYLSRFGKVEAIYQQALNSCLVVFKDVPTARRVANKHDLGLPYGRLYTKWWNPTPMNNDYLKAVKHVRKAAETRTRFHMLMDSDDRAAAASMLRGSARGLAEGNRFCGLSLKSYLIDGVKWSAQKPPPPRPAPPKRPKTGGVQNVGSMDVLRKHLNGEQLVVIDFFAQWCGPCKTMAPIFEELSKEFDDVNFLKVDVDLMMEAADECFISALPTFMFVRNGTQLDRIIGAKPDELRERILSLKK